MKFDDHIHLGNIWGNKRTETIRTSVKEVKEYIQSNELTHCCILYTDYHEFLELKNELPDVTFYGCKWVTDFENLVLDKKACGIKLHSSRGPQGPIDYVDRRMNGLLEQLPDNYIVYFHTSEMLSTKSQSTPLVVFTHAIKFPKLKFIVGHSGSFGLRTFYPTNKDKPGYKACLKIALLSECMVETAITGADKLKNVYLDSSLLINRGTPKVWVLAKSKRWCFGSDYPFNKVVGSTEHTPIKSQEELMIKSFNHTREDIDRIHLNGIQFFENQL